MNKSFYVYRQRGGSACSSSSRWKDLIEVRKYILEFLQRKNESFSVLSAYSWYSFNSLFYWYNKFSMADKTIKKQFKKEMVEYLKDLYKFANDKHKFLYNIYRYNLEGVYYKLFRLIGKYCVVLPYRKIKNFFKGN